MLTTVVFVRHAQPDWRVKDESRPLSAEGRRDARVVLEALRDKSIDACWCSPYPRSLETVRETAGHFGLEIRIDPRLRERDSGPGGNVPELFRRRWADHAFHEDGGESIAMVQARYVAAMADILAAHPGQAVLVGTHGTALSALLNHYDPTFGCDDFLRIIDWMPYILEMTFDGQVPVATRELAHVHKAFERKR